MNFFSDIFKFIKRFAWALVMAYMIAWHNVYKEKSDMPNTMEYHMENENDGSSTDKLI